MNLQLKKLLFFTGNSRNCVRVDRSPAFGDLAFLLLSRSGASKFLLEGRLWPVSHFVYGERCPRGLELELILR
jgi:hypothetical protein